jgi:hypothetical protein
VQVEETDDFPEDSFRNQQPAGKLDLDVIQCESGPEKNSED